MFYGLFMNFGLAAEILNQQLGSWLPHKSVWLAGASLIMWPDHQLYITAPFIDLADISDAGAQTKACVHLYNYLFEFYKEVNFTCLLSSLFHKNNTLMVSDIYCTPHKIM